MPTPTYTLISETVLGSAQASVTFNSFPSTYKDLVLEMITTGTQVDASTLRFNGDTGSNYSWTYIQGIGSTASSTRASNDTTINVGLNDTAPSISIVNIMSYSNTNVYKTTISRAGSSTTTIVRGFVGLWRSTSAITSLTMTVGTSSNFSSGSTFRLWGVVG